MNNRSLSSMHIRNLVGQTGSSVMQLEDEDNYFDKEDLEYY